MTVPVGILPLGKTTPNPPPLTKAAAAHVQTNQNPGMLQQETPQFHGIRVVIPQIRWHNLMFVVRFEDRKQLCCPDLQDEHAANFSDVPKAF